jgi:hypothetical protein
MKILLPEAKAIFEKKSRSAQAIKETWDAARVILVDGNQIAQGQLETAQQMSPDILLFKIEDRLARLENTFMQLSDAILAIEKGKEEVLGKTFYTMAQNQKDAGTMVRPERIEKVVGEQEAAEGGKVEEAAPQKAIQGASGSILGRKEVSDEAGKNMEYIIFVEQTLIISPPSTQRTCSPRF